MATLEEFDRQVKAVTSKGKLSSSLLQGVVDAAMANIASDSHLVSTLYRLHKKASAANKLTSLYLVDGIAREARSRQKRLDREGKGKGREGAAASPATPAVGSTTPTGSPPPANSPAAASASAGNGTYASFLKMLESGMLAKFVLDSWENGLPEHREKVRKVLDIWTKAATFSPSALARVSSKLLATSTAARPASPARPSLSPVSFSPPRDSTPSASASGPSNIPANVLALLQASSKEPPSHAAIEQKRQEEMQKEVERVLREAQMGTASAASPGYGSGPPAATAAPSYSAPSHAQSAYHAPPPSSYAQTAPPPSISAQQPGGAPNLALDPSQLAMLQQIAGGLPGGGATAQPPAPSVPSGQYPTQQQQQQQRPPPPQQQQSSGWGQDNWSSGPSANGRGHDARPSPAQQGYDGPRGQIRSFDEAQRGYGYAHERRDEPPAKRAFQPPPPQQQQQQQSPLHAPHAAAPAPSYATPAPVLAPAAAPVAEAAPASLDPASFDATSPASWSAFFAVLRAAHPYFAGKPNPPTMDEVMMLCAPSAMMAFGGGLPGGQGMMGVGMGMGGAGGGGAFQGSGGDGGFGEANGAGGNGGY